MQPISLTYEQWKHVHPHYRSYIDRVPYVACYDEGELRLARVTFAQRTRAAPTERRSGAGQLQIDID